MIRTKDFHNSVDKLVGAYFDGSLIKGSCKHCAVGTLLDNSNLWSYLFQTTQHTKVQLSGFDLINQYKKKGETVEIIFRKMVGGYDIIDQSAYSQNELMAIEKAFECAEEEEDRNSVISQFNGLMAVLDVLFEIHQVQDCNQQQYKEKFQPQNI